MGRGGLVVIYDDKMLELNKTVNTRLRALYEGGSGIILTLGDGDFSFSAALASQFNIRFPDGQSRLLASSYDSQAQVMTKYTSTAGVCLDTLKKMKVPVLHYIDATRLYQTLEVNKYRAMKRPDMLPIPQYVKNCSRIIFNFPNLGNLGADSTKIHQDLLKNFFIQCLPLLVRPTIKNNNENGEVHVALRNSPFYEKWDIVSMAEQIGYKLREKDIFRTENYPGYEEQRTNPGLMRAAPPKAEGATIYRFILDEQYLESLTAAGYMDCKAIDTANLNAYTKAIMPTDASSEHDLQTPDMSHFGTNSNFDENDFDNLQKNLQIEGHLNEIEKRDQNAQSKNQAKNLLVDNIHNLLPSQIVSLVLDTSSLKQARLPTYTVNNLPTGIIQFHPVYPLCPPPPEDFVLNLPTNKNSTKKIDPKTISPESSSQSSVSIPKVIKPHGLFEKYHSVLSTLDSTSRNFRLGLQEIKNSLFGKNDSKEPKRENPVLKQQIQQYTNESLVNGTLLIRLTRAVKYEEYYHQDLYQEFFQTKIEENAEKKPAAKTVLMKKVVNGKLTTVKVPMVGGSTKPVKNNTLSKADLIADFDLPENKRLYTAHIVAILTPETAKMSAIHTEKQNSKPAPSVSSSSSSSSSTGKKTTIIKTTTTVRKATSQDIDDAGDDVGAKVGHVNKKQQPVEREEELTEGELLGYLGMDENDMTDNNLAYQLATIGDVKYRAGYKEKERIRKDKLAVERYEREKKKLEWQAERRVKHCDERGTAAKRHDVQLVNKLKAEKEGKKMDKHNKKQERRIQKLNEE
jgi:hypothetical protein